VGMFARRLILFSSTCLVAALRLIAMWLGACRLGMCSSSAPTMFRMYDRTRSVRNLAWLTSYASFGQCW